MKPAFFLATALGLAAAPASAKPIDFSADIEGHLGYALDPRLEEGRTQSAGAGRFQFAPLLTAATSISQTTLTGDYEREQYTNSYGDTQSITATLTHNQSLNEHIQTTLAASYLRTNNLLLNDTLDPGLLGDLSRSQRLWHAQVNGSLTWQLSARDTVSAGTSYAHELSTFGDTGRAYDQYGGNLTYLRALNARTKIGLRAYVNRFDTQVSGNSMSVSPALVLQQAFSSIWKLDADAGIIIQRSDAPYSSTTTGLGFHATLCGTYPRSSMCLTAGRDNSATAFNGVRRQLTVTARYSYRLTEHGTLSFQASFLHEQSGGALLGLVPVSSYSVLHGTLDYNRRFTERLSAGVDARGGYRSDSFGSAYSVASSVYVRFKIG